MGADFLCNYIDVTDYKTMDAWRDAMLVKIGQVSDDRLYEAYSEMTGIDDPDEIDLNETRERLIEAVVHLHGRNRETTILPIAGHAILITGGMSWGESPSEAYDDMCWLDCAGLA